MKNQKSVFYLGSPISLLWALLLPTGMSIFFIGAYFFLKRGSNSGGFYLFCASLLGCFWLGSTLFALRRKLYSIAIFDKKGIRVFSLFSKGFVLPYSSYKEVGVRLFVPDIPGVGQGKRTYWVYFSQKPLPSRIRRNIHRVDNSEEYICLPISKRFLGSYRNFLPEVMQNDILKDFRLAMESKSQLYN